MKRLISNVRDWLQGRNHHRIGQSGRWAERIAAQHLKTRRYRILATNLRVGRGELDLLALDPDKTTHVVVEVKAATSDAPRWRPEHHANPAKQRQLLRLTQQLIKQRSLGHHPWRIDLITVTQTEPDTPPTIRHHTNFVQL
ncbi:YraN family protein [Mucisphaera calidilacus]|uniref:Uncharacterized protein n=1 Tax=Mucisphaera calidilacus TaxID=2527982 RepID=A0A518C0E9_9BACT|nr:YraN family protein [Mucisphaera calidilacus]QDU72694.1 hypothetical protein Pan265_25680 [Mucisphaera calidilacus]